jgi:isocitrate/isopropylmalate dehydrogenase
MRSYKIAVMRGDGIGPEIVDEGIKVLEAVAEPEGLSLIGLSIRTVRIISWRPGNC